MTAINWGKVLTACCLALCVLQHGGLRNTRQVQLKLKCCWTKLRNVVRCVFPFFLKRELVLQVVYIGVHGAYLLYWMVHQYAVPEWEPFADPATPPIVILALAVIGVG